MTVQFIIFASSLFLYLLILALYAVMIARAKKTLSEEEKKALRGGKKFYAVFVFSLILIVLPILIYFETFVMIVLCACALIGEYIVLKDMLDTIKQKC